MKGMSSASRQSISHFRKAGTRYDGEAVYQYLVTAGWNVREAMRLAEEAGDRRVPLDPHTWKTYIVRHKLQHRYEQETKVEWQLFHNEREARRQHTLDVAAAMAEKVIVEWAEMMGKALTAMKKRENYELLLFRKDFVLGPEAFDRLFRVYLRAVGLPERITHSLQEQRPTTVLTYAEAEWQKQLSEAGRITRPMIAKDLAEAMRLVGTLDLGPEWALPEDEKDPAMHAG